MIVLKKLTMDLARRSLPVQVDMVQGDSAAWLEFSLLSSGATWEMPSGAVAMVRYQLSNGTGGEYDTVDGERAWKKNGDALQIALAPGVCSMPGVTRLQITILKDGEQISTFPVELFVEGAVTGSGAPENYTNLSQWLKYNTGDQYLNLGEVEERLDALERGLSSHKASTHLTEEDVRRLIADDPWGVSTYNGEMEDV